MDHGRARDRVRARVRDGALAHRGRRASPHTPTRHPAVAPALGVARATVRVAVAILALITALESLGVPVAPLLTTLGIGSLAVALALQDTLANFFAGLYLLADRPVRTGDYVKLHEGAEGFVETIGWRSSRLRTSSNNIVVVPNSQAVDGDPHQLPPAGRERDDDRRGDGRRIRQTPTRSKGRSSTSSTAPSRRSPSCAAASRSSAWPS